MKTRTVTWIAALALTGICAGQQSEIQKKYDEERAQSMKRAVAAYPDLAKADSPLGKKSSSIEKALGLTGDPRYYYSEMPMIIAGIAAKELNINSVATASSLPAKKPSPVMLRLTTAPWEPPKSCPVLEPDSKQIYLIQTGPETISEFQTLRGDAYKSVTISLVEPDGLRIRHESGAKKITVENLTEEQRSQYGITMEGATQYRRQVAVKTAAYDAQQQEAARQAQADAEAATVAAQAAAAQEARNRANRPVAQAPVWKRFVTNEDFRKSNRADIADEIRRQDGNAAAERFLTEERLKDLEEDKGKIEKKANRRAQASFLDDGTYLRSGDRITIKGDLTGGYQIKGDKLHSFQTGAPTHTRSGSMWVPLISGQKQIYDP